jgi:energy-coupling factor transport system ATP-binding protein
MRATARILFIKRGSMSFIEIKDISFRYPSKEAIKNISFSINQGEWIAVVGPNGSGKSTLAKLIIGLLTPQSGEIFVDGQKLSPDTVYDIRRKIGIIFQNPDNQFVGVTVRDDIAFGLENLQVPYEEMIQRIDTYAAKLKMTEFLDKEPSALSGGQKQRVAIAGSLAMQPEVMIFDEATSMLDPKGRLETLDSMRELRAQKTTLLTITHDLKEALQADRVIVLNEGAILASGQPKEILSNTEILKTARLALIEPLELIEKMKAEGINNPDWEAKLWQFALTL